MQGSLIKFHILFHCLLDGGQFKMSQGIDILVDCPGQSYNIWIMMPEKGAFVTVRVVVLPSWTVK